MTDSFDLLLAIGAACVALCWVFFNLGRLVEGRRILDRLERISEEEDKRSPGGPDA